MLVREWLVMHQCMKENIDADVVERRKMTGVKKSFLLVYDWFRQVAEKKVFVGWRHIVILFFSHLQNHIVIVIIKDGISERTYVHFLYRFWKEILRQLTTVLQQSDSLLAFSSNYTLTRVCALKCILLSFNFRRYRDRSWRYAYVNEGEKIMRIRVFIFLGRRWRTVIDIVPTSQRRSYDSKWL